MSTNLNRAWRAAQQLGAALNTAETFVTVDDHRAATLAALRDVRTCLGQIALALADEHEATAPKQPAWMTTDQEAQR